MGPPSGGGKGIDVIDTALHGRQRVFMKRRSDPGAAEPVGNAGIRREHPPGAGAGIAPRRPARFASAMRANHRSNAITIHGKPEDERRQTSSALIDSRSGDQQVIEAT